ncbi:MAG: serine hydrolase [Bacteroidales bacterium]|nr:serine hydrolase [Bacteroidales bacterium]
MLKTIKTKLCLFLSLIMIFPSCHVGRYFYWNYAGITDYKKFPSEPVSSGEKIYYFEQPAEKMTPALPGPFATDDKSVDLRSFLDQRETVAFLVIRNDTILMEEYFDKYTEDAIIASFSLSKSFISALTGILIAEGYIQSVHEPVTDFLPELLTADLRFGDITLEHLLNMRSGIRFNEGYSNPFSDMAKYYYGTNLNRYIRKLKIERPPDEVYDYISVNNQLLGMALERATGKHLPELLEEKIWKPLGMEYDASWSVDSKRNRQTKAFCCINARAVDLAKFGRLYLNKGNWNDKQIIPEAWVDSTMRIVNDSRDSQGYPYTYQWRVKEDGAIFAKGVLGQYIYVFPKKNIIIVRMGKKDGGMVWPEFFERLCEQL